MKGLDEKLAAAIQHFWRTREEQGTAQGGTAGERDRGGRSEVTGGAQMDGFVNLVSQLLVESGLPDACLYQHKNLELPGYFRPTKCWDLLAVVDGDLLGCIEVKSQVGSFGNNFNNRTEEAIGTAADLWTAYREGAFKGSPRPWLGYLMLLEEAPGSLKPIGVAEPHFKVFEEFRGSSYARRYELLCLKLVRERLYDAACFLLSDRVRGPQGYVREPEPEVNFLTFATSLTGHAVAYAKRRS
jgi:Restriction endonuclease XhoI